MATIQKIQNRKRLSLARQMEKMKQGKQKVKPLTVQRLAKDFFNKART